MEPTIPELQQNKKNNAMGCFWVIVSMAIVFVGFYLFFVTKPQNEQDWKITCTLPKTKGHIQTVTDYRICLSERNITPTDADIRKMCYYYSRDEYYVQYNAYPTDTDPQENSLYYACLHEQGLGN